MPKEELAMWIALKNTEHREAEKRRQKAELAAHLAKTKRAGR